VGRAEVSSSMLSYRAFRWTTATGMQNLGTLSNQYETHALSVTANGTIVVGRAVDAQGRQRAVRWRTVGQTEDLNQVYTALLQGGSLLRAAHSVSWDGRYIAGEGYNAAAGRSEAFLLDTWRQGDVNGSGCIDDADLLAVLFTFGSQGSGLTQHEDINKDGIVDDADLLLVLFNFGSGC
ncbi:MAG: hypothetical protein N2651_03305, partial [Fimbriimonadales bacterium]|nr:hypothetical protein [Fimbriimonadales bacterium]